MPCNFSSTLFILARKATSVSRAKMATRLFSLSSKVPRMGVKDCTEIVTVVDEEAYISSLVRSSGITWQCCTEKRPSYRPRKPEKMKTHGKEPPDDWYKLSSERFFNSVFCTCIGLEPFILQKITGK